MSRKAKSEPASLHHGGNYVTHRQLAYPPLVEFADAFYHERRGNPQPMEEYLAKIDAVKSSISKPSG
jgi:hypothetical protein